MTNFPGSAPTTRPRFPTDKVRDGTENQIRSHDHDHDQHREILEFVVVLVADGCTQHGAYCIHDHRVQVVGVHLAILFRSLSQPPMVSHPPQDRAMEPLPIMRTFALATLQSRSLDTLRRLDS